MIVEGNFLNRLKDFGLNSYEAKIWTALLSRGISSAGELSDISNVPRSRSYDVLESLEKKGFIIMKIGKPIKYIAVPPEEVINRVKKKAEDDVAVQLNNLELLKDSQILTELNMLHTQGVSIVEPNDLTGAIKGRQNIHSHLSEMIGAAEKEVIIMTTDDGLKRKGTALKRAFEKASAKGVKIRIAAPINAKSREAATLLQKVADIKHTDDIKGRFVIVDGKQISFMLMSDKELDPTYDIGIWASSEFFVKAMKDMFDRSWKDMKPFSN